MSNVEESFSQALMFHRTGITSKAICYYKKVLAIEPAHEISQHHLSVLKFGLGHYKKALSLQNNLININPHKAGYYNNRGNTLLRLGDFQKAISDFNHAIELDPHKAEFLVNRSNALSCLDEYPEALFDLDEAIKVDANLAIAYANRANVHTPAAEVSVEPTLFQPSFC
jgi:tetratricopeptide (TPR) repeat protein